MISVRYYCVGSIILLSLLSASHTQQVSSYLKPFVNFFRYPEMVFDVVFILSRLSYDDKVKVCTEFANGSVTQIGEIVLVHLDRQVDPSIIPEVMPAIPSFMCKPAYGADFFVTHSPKYRYYYKLFESVYEIASTSNAYVREPVSRYNPHPNRTLVEVHDSKEITTSYRYQDVHGTRLALYDYFMDDEYSETATKTFKQFEKNPGYLSICYLFPTLVTRTQHYKADLYVSEIKFHDLPVNKEIPCLYCSPQGDFNETTTFKVFYYYGGILFHGRMERYYKKAIEYSLRSYRM